MANRILILATLAFAAFYLYLTMYHIRVHAFGDPVGPRMFPLLLCGGLVLSCGLMAWEAFAAGSPATAQDPQAELGHPFPFVVALLAIGCLVYVGVFETIGFIVSTAAFLLGLTTYFNRGRHIANVGTAVLMPVATFLLFKNVLDVNLPSGILPF